MASSKVSVLPLPRTGRSLRHPQHPFHIRQRPFGITPFFIAPVLPGETMESLLWQSRVVTDPIVNPLIGWWCEYYFFYVKHRDLGDRAEFESMMLDPAWDDANVDSATTVRSHYYENTAAGIDWIDFCLKRICDGAGAYGAPVTFFRDTGEAWNIATTSDSLPMAKAFGQTVFDSLRLVDDEVAEDVQIDVTDNNVSASEIDAALRRWSELSELGLTDMSYEDYLATFGTRPTREELHIPELVRFVRRWSYPSNTINPETGAPSSAVSWGITERGDKKRFFKEPGFLIGLSIVRPKMYFGNQHSTVTSRMNSALAWLPAVLADNPSASRILANDTLFPVSDANGATIDIKDLLLYGEQFLNYTPFSSNTAGHHLANLPNGSTLDKSYVDSADIAKLFVDQDVVDPAHTATEIYVRQDGLVSLSISGRQVDTSITRIRT